MNISPGWLGIIRGIATAALMGGLVFLENAANLTAVIGPGWATLIAAAASSLALGLEHKAEGNTGRALFGAVISR